MNLNSTCLYSVINLYWDCSHMCNTFTFRVDETLVLSCDENMFYLMKIYFKFAIRSWNQFRDDTNRPEEDRVLLLHRKTEQNHQLLTQHLTNNNNNNSETQQTLWIIIIFTLLSGPCTMHLQAVHSPTGHQVSLQSAPVCNFHLPHSSSPVDSLLLL